MPDALLAALAWDPQLKGAVIVIISAVLLPGSAYFLLSTNTGSRLAFLLAAAGLMGWMVIMGLVWTVYGIGLKGKDPTWVPQTTVRGDVARSSHPALAGFPREWKSVGTDNPDAAEAQAIADAVLAPPADSGKKGPYASATDYLPVAAYQRGGETYFFTLRHRAHYLLLQVQATAKQEAAPGSPPPRPRADPSQPVTSVLLVRDLGSLRVPPAQVTVFSLVLFGLLVYVLHRRDKEAMAMRSQAQS